ncbi:MAG: pentapeptide repeat-containing protein [Oscillospiraceae bacterium]|nr:pentapeptide repeat-containing protein [Oscillospiraceae bacterium]
MKLKTKSKLKEGANMKLTVEREGTIVKGTFEDFPERWISKFDYNSPLAEADGFKVCSLNSTQFKPEILFLSGSKEEESSGKFERDFSSEEKAQEVFEKVEKCFEIMRELNESPKNLAEILEAHKKWLEAEYSGSRANLRGADLRGADLSYANLRGADLRGADLRGADLSYADLRGADLRGADLSYADLRGADLSRADLRGAYLDFSCLPLWCGSLSMIVDRRITAQIAYHFSALKCDDPEAVELQKSLYDFANTFHRVGEIPKLGVEAE